MEVDVIIKEIPDSVHEIIDDLVVRYSRIREIWLFGSSVNGSHKPNDYDLLIFADQSVLDSLENEGPERYLNLDIMVVYDADNFRGPWRPEGKGDYSRGSLTEWKWKEVQPGLSTYNGAKDVPGGIKPEITTCRAIRLFQREPAQISRVL